MKILQISLLYLLLQAPYIHTADGQYKIVTSERSGTEDGDIVEAACSDGYLLVRCRNRGSAKFDGLRTPIDGSHSCLAKNGFGGDGVIVSWKRNLSNFKTDLRNF